MYQSLLFVYNTQSGTRMARQNLDLLIKELYQKGFDLTVCPIGTTRDVYDILSRRKFDAVACVGGDGTLHHTVNAIFEREKKMLPLMYFPSGSTNDFAGTLNLPQAVQKNMAQLKQNVQWRLDLGDFNGKKFCYIAAFGFLTQVSYCAPKEMKHLLGHFAYFLEGMRWLDLSKSYAAKVRLDDVELEGCFCYGSISNTKSVGGFSFPMSSQVVLDDGFFEVLLVRQPQSFGQMTELIQHLMTQNFDSGDLIFQKAKKVEIIFDRPVAWTLDGEYGGEKMAVQIHILNKSMPVFV